MRLNIYVNKPEINGYNNVDLATQTIDFNNMNSIAEQAECTEIILDDVLHYIKLQQIPDFLSRVISRLRINGKIIVLGTDLYETLKSYNNGLFSIADLNAMLFGTQTKKCSCFSHADILSLLSRNGLNIESIELNSGQFIITARRKAP